MVAMTDLCEEIKDKSQHKWLPALLNHNFGARIEDFIAKHSAYSPADTYAIMIEELAEVSFSKEQIESLLDIRKTVNGMLLLQGGGGSGKSKVLTTMANFLARAGFHVLASAPAHTTTDRLLEAIEAL